MLTPYVASLRVYEPINSFGKADRVRWEDLNIDTNTGQEEQLSALRRLIEFKGRIHLVDGAHILLYKGSRYVAPWSTVQRCRDALDDFRSSLPSSVLPMFFSSEGELDELEGRLSISTGQSHILSETWIIPPRWFTLFLPSERLRGRTDKTPFTVMRTEISLAKQRCITTHQAVKEAFGQGPVEQELVEMLNWLNVFDPHSIVECDYGGLAIYVEQVLREENPPGLEADTSIEDVLDSIEGLIEGDAVRAGQGYERLVSRWRKVSALEQAM
jgi:hypothetical protein